MRNRAVDFGRDAHAPLPRRFFALALLLGPMAACGDGTGPPPATPLEVVIESGDGQVAAAGDTLPEPIVVMVVEAADGTPSLRSIWVELVDGGRVDLGGVRGAGEGVVLRSPTAGPVSATWTLSEDLGTQRLRFFALELYGDTVEAFASAESEPGPGSHRRAP